ARQAMCVSTPPTIDGKLDDWRAVPPVTYTIPGLTTKTRVAWDATNLYLAVEVQGAFRPNRPDSIPNFWAQDAIEVFLDLGNQKSLLYDADDMQLFFCPLAVTGDAALGGKAIRQRQGDLMNIVAVVADPDMRTVSTITETGYTQEGVIPWRTLSPTFRPQPGVQLGCDVAIDHAKNKDGLSLSTSIFGLTNKPFGQPNRWGTLTLLAPGVTPVTPKLIVPPAPEAAAAPDTTIRFSRTQTDGWLLPAKPVLSEKGLRLANGGGGTNLLLKAPIPAPLTDAGVTTRFTIAGFEKAPGNVEANQTPFRTDLRAYWTPKLPEGYIEPYGMSDCLTLRVEYRDEQTSFELYKKVGVAQGGWGPLLWSGSMVTNAYPITVTFWVNKTDYQISVSTPVETRHGSRSGQHGLPVELWAQPVRFGLKSVYGTQPADLIIDTVEIKAGK
ncbi:MAG TPA: sugar-binding protein, partial [Armatimonadota bacterium]